MTDRPEIDPAVRLIVAACSQRLQYEATIAINAEVERLVADGHDQWMVNAGAVSAVSALLYSAIVALIPPEHRISTFGDAMAQMAGMFARELASAQPGVTIQ